jgi:transposase-like protein
VSDLCDQHDIYPNQFYGWLKDFFENGHLAFDTDRKAKAVEDAKDQQIQQLHAKLARKNEVMAELMEAHAELKKSFGET